MTDPRLLVRVVTAAQAAARDTAAIRGGTTSPVLMDRAGTRTAQEIERRLGPLVDRPVLVLCGPGNNGGDGWVVARVLARGGARVAVCEVVAAKSDDARGARERARAEGGSRLREIWLADAGREPCAIVVDALLGTGSAGAPRGAVAEAVATARRLRGAGARTVAVDLPTGLDADTGEAANAVQADFTFTYGTIKRGQLVSRGVCGAVVVIDIGLGRHAGLADDAPLLVDEPWVAARVPVIHADAHKGSRRKLAIVGGADGMSGAVILAARSALRSGAGLVKVFAERSSLAAVRCAEPAALTGTWPATADAARRAVGRWADAVAIGPGLGRTPQARRIVERFLTQWKGPVVLDADGLNVFAGRIDALAALLEGRPAVITPHPAEFARLTRTTVREVLAHRFEIGRRLAARLGATVLLKGTPTVVFASDGTLRYVSAAGTPVLATGGSGDLLTGITGTLLAQMEDPTEAAACAAWVHGRAAELVQLGARRAEQPFDPDLDESLGDEAEVSASAADSHERPARRDARGLTLDDVLSALPEAWRLSAAPPRAPVLVELPAVEHPA